MYFYMCYVVIASLAVGVVVFLCAVPYLAEGIPTFSIFLVFMVLFVWVGISFLSSTTKESLLCSDKYCMA